MMMLAPLMASCLDSSLGSEERKVTESVVSNKYLIDLEEGCSI